MSTLTLERQEPANGSSEPEPAGMVREKEVGPLGMSCPVCGSGSTYQTQDGRWGCTQCHSTWA